tara:strand:+ start:198 stop:590 length:393 start_codon:yes stop_codon:yes gene_type:complete
MSSKSKRKGSGFELEIARCHQALGIAANKTPLSGALGGKYAGDVQIAGMIAECKRRKKGYTSLYKALAQGGGSDVLFVRDDHQDTLVVLPWDTWEAMLGWCDLAKKFPHRESEVSGTDMHNAKGENENGI